MSRGFFKLSGEDVSTNNQVVFSADDRGRTWRKHIILARGLGQMTNLPVISPEGVIITILLELISKSILFQRLSSPQAKRVGNLSENKEGFSPRRVA
jgi:hypothetical protein